MSASNKILLEVNNLQVSVGDKSILKGLNLTLRAGEVHALMGPNGSGKSTFAHVLGRKEGYLVTQGEIRFLGNDLLTFSPEEAACLGLFLGFQYPISIPGVSNVQFLKSSLNAVRKAQNLPPLDAMDFLNLVKRKMALLEMPEALLYRGLNDGFSGGEKKRNEILQMALLQPKLAVLDETDSGLDIDALKAVAKGINQEKNENNAILLITHYQRLLDYIQPDFVHVISEGKIVKSGDKSLALTLENQGYAWLEKGTI
jgi:Fe-S cluster assembly ATP-binding protein